MWTYALTNHLMVELETFIALGTMTYTTKFFLYEVYLMDEGVLNDFISDK